MIERYIDRKFEIKSINEAGEFSGYGAVFGNIDSDRDIIEKGAFTETLEKHKSNGTLPAMLWQHDHHEPIGVYKHVEEDSLGLYVEGELLLEADPTARRAHAHMKAGSVTGMSIGYQIPKGGYEYDANKDVFHLKQLDVHEISIVTFPSNERARVQTVKSFLDGGDVPPPSIVERALRDAGFDRQQAKAIMADGYKGIATRDAEDDLEPLQLILERIKA